MAYIPRSSFIPKETNGAIPLKVKRKRTIHIFNLLATVVLVIAVLSVIGTYFYANVLTKRLDVAKEELSKANDVNNAKKMDEIREYDLKLSTAKKLLSNHISASQIFEEIENSTKETVRFSNFKYTYDPGYATKLELSGETETFASVALQKMQYIEDELFSDFSVKNISTSVEEVAGSDDKKSDEDEKMAKVSFTVTGIFQKDLLRYTGSSTSETGDVPLVQSTASSSQTSATTTSDQQTTS